MEERHRANVVMLSTHLLEEELDYELRIRQLDSTSVTTREQKESVLEENGNLPPFADVMESLDLVEELQVLKMKISEINAVSSEVHSKYETGLEPQPNERLNTVFVHTMARIRRVMFRSPKYFDEFKKLASKLNSAWHRLRTVYSSLSFPKIPTSSDDDSEEEQQAHEQRKREKQERVEFKKEQEETRRREDERQQHEVRKGEREAESRRKEEDRRRDVEKGKYSYRSRCDYSSESSSASTPSDSSEEEYKHKKKSSRAKGRNPVAFWEFKYSGSSGSDLYGFLEDVEEAADTNNVSDEELLRGIGVLLTDSARTWHRARKKKLSSWKVFKKEICAAFSPSDCDDDIMDKINSLRQKSDETYVVYEARCLELFHRLSDPLNDRDKLKKTYKGLHLYYKNKISSHDATSLRELRKACGRLEKDKVQIQRQENEERRKERKKEDKEDRRDQRKSVRVAATKVELSEESEGSVDVAGAQITVPGKNALVCWRCGECGHLSNSCTKKIFCVGCGAQGVLAERCKTCARANQQGKWTAPTQPQGNATGGMVWGAWPPFSVPPPNYKPPENPSKNPGNQ